MIEPRDSNQRPLQIAHLLAGGSYGGLESVVSSLTRGLVALGHQCHVIAILDAGAKGGNAFLDEIGRAGVRVVPLQLGNRAYVRERQAIGKTLDRLMPNVLHTHGYRADVQGIAAARRARVPVMSTAHGFTGGGLKNRLFEFLQERSLSRADRVVAVSRPILQRLEGSGVAPDRLRWIANAWEPAVPPLSRREARELLGLDASRRVFGWVGRLSPEKGGDVFVHAMASIRTPGAIACIVGDGPERARMEQLGRNLGISDRLHFAGVIPQAARVFPAFDVFCLSSRTEGTPIALLEAMSARIPIVATKVGGVPDVVSQSEAWLVDLVDPAAIGEALDAAASLASVVATRIDAASERLRRHFAVGPWLDRYVEIYTDLASGSAGPGSIMSG